ncbi:TPA: DUF1642 domain-containing protein [Streptococcus suis]
MNKQELEKQAEALYADVRSFLDNTFELIDQIHEPQKVVVPKFVAEYIERCRQSGWHLQKVLSRLDDDEKVGDWAYDENDDPISEKVDMVAQAWIFGYEVEKERLYEVTIPGTSNYKNQTQHLVKQGKNWFFCGNDVNRFKYRFTKGQIEAAGFGWVFGCNGVKIEEV